MEYGVVFGVGVIFSGSISKTKKPCPAGSTAAEEVTLSGSGSIEIATGLYGVAKVTLPGGAQLGGSLGVKGPSVKYTISGEASTDCCGKVKDFTATANIAISVGGSVSGSIDLWLASAAFNFSATADASGTYTYTINQSAWSLQITGTLGLTNNASANWWVFGLGAGNWSHGNSWSKSWSETYGGSI